MNLEALLIISGYNHSASHLAAANFFFVGWICSGPLCHILCKWASEDLSGDMEKTLKIFLQSRIMATANVAMLSSIIWPFHWFPPWALVPYSQERAQSNFWNGSQDFRNPFSVTQKPIATYLGKQVTGWTSHVNF